MYSAAVNMSVDGSFEIIKQKSIVVANNAQTLRLTLKMHIRRVWRRNASQVHLHDWHNCFLPSIKSHPMLRWRLKKVQEMRVNGSFSSLWETIRNNNKELEEGLTSNIFNSCIILLIQI